MGVVTQPKGSARVNKVKDVSMDDLEYLIEQKVLEILGSFDSGIDPHAASQHQMKMKTEFNYNKS